MNENKFLYYITICEERNLTKASEKLFISQPSLTKYINSLEKELGLKLMDRKSVPIFLTEAGEVYLEYSKDMLNRYKELKESMEEIKEKEGNTIVFGISSNLSKYYLNDVINIAKEINPDFDFRVIEDTSFNMQELIKDGYIDVGFLNTENLESEDIYYSIIQEDRICLVCNKNNPILIDKKINENNEYVFSKEEISSLPFYSREKTFQLTKSVENYLIKMGVKIENIIEIKDLTTIFYLLCSTNRLAFVPEFLMNASGFKDKLSICSVENEDIKWYMTLAYSKKRKLNINTKKWIKKMKDFYKEKDW